MDARRIEAEQRYIRGENTQRIARDFGVAGETVRRWLAEAGIPRRTASERNRRYQYRSDAFTQVDPVTSYWAGLLMADGSVEKRGLISLELHIMDRELVEGLSHFIDYTGPLAKRTRQQKSGHMTELISLRVAAPDLAKQLARWGVVPRKTFDGLIGDLGGTDAHFYRGLFDGDGCIHRRKSGRMYASLCGNPSVVDSFRDWCWRTFREVGSLNRRKKYHVVQFGGKRAIALGHALYDISGPRLTRKEELFRLCQ